MFRLEVWFDDVVPTWRLKTIPRLKWRNIFLTPKRQDATRTHVAVAFACRRYQRFTLKAVQLSSGSVRTAWCHADGIYLKSRPYLTYHMSFLTPGLFYVCSLLYVHWWYVLASHRVRSFIMFSLTKIGDSLRSLHSKSSSILWGLFIFYESGYQFNIKAQYITWMNGATHTFRLSMWRNVGLWGSFQLGKFGVEAWRWTCTSSQNKFMIS